MAGSQLLVSTGAVGALTSDAQTVLLLHCNGTDAARSMTDFSQSAKAVTFAGTTDQIDTAQSKFGGGSLLLDGDSDYITLLDSDDWAFGAKDFTIEFWVRFNSVTGNQQFVSQWLNADNQWAFRKYDAAGGHKLRFFSYQGAAWEADYVMTNAWAVVTNQWYHIAAVRNSANFYLFIDGVSQAVTKTVDIGTGAYTNVGATLQIGRTPSGDYYINGWLDEIRISKDVARYISNFTPQSREFGNEIAKPIRVYSLDVLSGAVAGQIKLYNGTGTDGTLWVHETCATVSSGNEFEYGEEGILFKDGCFLQEVTDANVTSTLVQYEKES